MKKIIGIVLFCVVLMFVGLAGFESWSSRKPIRQLKRFFDQGQFAKVAVLAREYLADNPQKNEYLLHLALAYDSMGVETFPDDICDHVIHISNEPQIKFQCAMLLATRAEKMGLVERALQYYLMSAAFQKDEAATAKIETLKAKCTGVDGSSTDCSLSRAQTYLQEYITSTKRSLLMDEELACSDPSSCPFLGVVFESREQLCKSVVPWLIQFHQVEVDADATEEDLYNQCDWSMTADWIGEIDLAEKPAAIHADNQLVLRAGVDGKTQIGVVDLSIGMGASDFFVVLKQNDRWRVLSYFYSVYNPGAFGIMNSFYFSRFEQLKDEESSQEVVVFEYALDGHDIDAGVNRVSTYFSKFLMFCSEQKSIWSCSEPQKIKANYCLSQLSDSDEESAAHDALIQEGLLTDVDGDVTYEGFEAEGYSKICGYPEAYVSESVERTYTVDLKKHQVLFVETAGENKEFTVELWK